MQITNIRHFLTGTGEIPDDLPRPALQIVMRLARIVAQVTECLPESDIHGKVASAPCVKRPERKPCPGYVDGGYSTDNPLSIWWRCSWCGDAGIISGWENTQWDKRESQRELSRRGWKRRGVTAGLEVPVSCLKEITIYRPHDLHDYARLRTELRHLRDKRRPNAGTCYLTVHGLAGAFASFVDNMSPDTAIVADALAKAGFPLRATIVPDE